MTDDMSTHAVYLIEDATLGEHFLVDGIDCPLEKRVSEHVHQLTGKNFYFARVGGIRNDRELRIAFAPSDSHEVAVGVFRGLLDVLAPREKAETAKATKRGLRWRWLKRLFGGE